MKDLLGQAIEQIRTLRRHNEILQAKVQVMDLFALVLHTRPASQSVGMEEDVAWKLQKHLDEIINLEKANAHKGHTGDRTDEGGLAGNGG